jgi:predicted ribosome quality control (RQC) complex YloA/Tae2 family protein
VKSNSADGYTSLNDAICDIAIDLSRKSAERSIRQRLANGIKAQRKKLEGKRNKLDKIVADAENASRYKEWAELLTINIGKIRRGMTTVTVPNLYDETMPEIAIPLLPELSPSANIKRLFKRYRKLTDGKTESEKQIAQISRELDQLVEYKAELESAAGLGDLLKLDKELVKAKILKKREAPVSTHRAEPEPEFNPRQYVSHAGEQILVGRNNKENEFVSFVAAKKHDIWFHSQQTPGSHVILKLKDKNIEPTHESILTAAQIAAYYSQARTSEKVPIIYTEARYLQKIKGGLPGKVRYSRVKSIMVEPSLPDNHGST